MTDAMRTAYRTCPLCEATCGLEIRVTGDEVVSIRGDAADVFSEGFLCPKGVAMGELHRDPDRVRAPLVKRGDRFVEVSWDEAFAEIDRRLTPLLAEHGRNAVGVYLGNPSAHSLSAMLYGRVLVKALGTRSIFSASTVDQMPKHVSSGLMFGSPVAFPIPDVDRTDHLLILGANPLASNGSLLTAPNMRGRLRAIRTRGGKVVVIDPRFSRTAEEADEHHFIRPGTDALLLFSMVKVLADEHLVAPGPLAEQADGLDDLLVLAEPFAPERVAEACGIEADEIRRLARELAAAPTAAVYGRIGTTTQEFGTLASWLVDVLNFVTGNLDRQGGAMFTTPAIGSQLTRGEPGRGRGFEIGRWHSRVRGLPEALGEIPVATLSEEIETPGEGQIRALVTIAGNPARSTPNSARLERAIESLDFMVSVDIYVNETTRHADVILPAPSALERSHYDVALYGNAVRNVANYSEPVFEPDPASLDEWEILLRLAALAAGQGPNADIEAFDDFIAAEAIRRDGRDVEETMAALAPRRGPERLLDFMLRTGPYGITLADLEEAPHGIDFGPMKPMLPDAIRTPDGRIHLLPEPIAADVPRLIAALDRAPNGFVLIGRRNLRSNNSWMHNLPMLVRGPAACTLHVHPDDAERLGLEDGELARVRSRTGELEIPVEVTEKIMLGVVSIPHGWGHDEPEAEMAVAAEFAGANSNALADEELLDPLSGNAVLNGIPVTLAPVAAQEPAVA